MAELVACGHPSGCQCVRTDLARVPCGIDTAALCRASMRVRDGRWVKGAKSHVFASLLRELQRDGIVLARLGEERDG